VGLWRYERQEALLHPFHRKQRRTGIHGVSAITSDCYQIQTGCAPGLHPETTGKAPSARAEHGRHDSMERD
jgi:hypothetical protein